MITGLKAVYEDWHVDNNTTNKTDKNTLISDYVSLVTYNECFLSDVNDSGTKYMTLLVLYIIPCIAAQVKTHMP